MPDGRGVRVVDELRDQVLDARAQDEDPPVVDDVVHRGRQARAPHRRGGAREAPANPPRGLLGVVHERAGKGDARERDAVRHGAHGAVGGERDGASEHLARGGEHDRRYVTELQDADDVRHRERHPPR